MTKEEFKLIEDSWTKLSEDAHNHYDNILATEDILNLKVSELQELVSFSKSFICNMEALFCDFRHIIGMAELKVTDRSKLISLFRDITSFRPDAKRISQIKTIDIKSYIPTQTSYELKLTPGINLISNLRQGQQTGTIVKDDFLDNNIVVKKISDTLLEVSFEENYIADFRRMFFEASKVKTDPTVNLSEFIKKLDSGTYGGFPVSKQNSTYYVSILFKQEAQNIFDYFKNKINSEE